MKKNDIYNSVNVDLNTNKSNYINESNKVKYIYQSIFFSPINKLECINSMDIYDDILVYGTIMGNVNLCHIDKNYLYPKPKKSSKLLTYISNKDEKENQIPFIRLNKLEEKKNDINDNGVKSHCNLTYSMINHEESEEKESNKPFKKKINFVYDSPTPVKDGEKEEKIYNNNDINYELESENNFNNDDIIPYPQITPLINNAAENISCVVFDTKNNIILTVGDYEFIKLENIATLNINDSNSKFYYFLSKNYDSNKYHKINCENSFCFLTKDNFFLIHMIFSDYTSIISEDAYYVNKSIKSFENQETTKGKINMSNFTIPFDFDGKNFLFLENLDQNLRQICIYDTLNKAYIFERKIDKEFGHISFMKLMKNNMIFLVKKYIFCEMHKINDEFEIVKSWKHVGEDIVAVEIYYEGSKITKEFYEDYKNKKNKNEVNAMEENINISFDEKEKNIIKFKFNGINQNNINFNESSCRGFNKNKVQSDIIIVNKYKDKKKEEFIEDKDEIFYNKNSNEEFSVATLDINGNFNLYKNDKNNVLFNLYSIKGIEQKYKDEEFFYLKYPYYISFNEIYICISTDHGIFTITKCEDE